MRSHPSLEGSLRNFARAPPTDPDTGRALNTATIILTIVVGNDLSIAMGSVVMGMESEPRKDLYVTMQEVWHGGIAAKE